MRSPGVALGGPYWLLQTWDICHFVGIAVFSALEIGTEHEKASFKGLTWGLKNLQ